MMLSNFHLFIEEYFFIRYIILMIKIGNTSNKNKNIDLIIFMISIP